ncbi:MAG: hypothetical protein CL477_03030 [Acidobacteria bacterium]|nr:hypothetical protein [Acidobacteriota bacterium]
MKPVSDDHPLLRGEKLFRELLDAAPDAMVITDRSGRIEVVNRQAVTMFGYTAAELAGSPVEQLVPLGLTAVQSTPEESSRELEARRKDGTTFPCEVSLSPLVSDGAPLVIATIRDITKRRQLEEQFQQAQKLEAIGRLAGGIAHDFNNRLTAILGYADMALAQLNPSHPLWRDLQEIKTAANRSSTLTRQLLAFSRRQVLRVEALSLNDVVRQTDRMLERIIGEQITRDLKLDEAVPLIRADAGQLEQILTNLAVNAKDAISDGGCLTIETHAAHMTRHHVDARPGMVDGHYAVLSVTDSGHGMTRAVRDKIFEPFYTTKAPGEGTGLGLRHRQAAEGPCRGLERTGPRQHLSALLPRHRRDGAGRQKLGARARRGGTRTGAAGGRRKRSPESGLHHPHASRLSRDRGGNCGSGLAAGATLRPTVRPDSD